MILNTNWDPLKAQSAVFNDPRNGGNLGCPGNFQLGRCTGRTQLSWYMSYRCRMMCIYIYMYVGTDTHTWAFADPMTWWIQDPLWEERLWYQVRGPPFLLTALFLTAPFRRTVGRQARRDARKIHHGTANNMGITNVLQFTLHINIFYCNSQLKISIVAPFIYI